MKGLSKLLNIPEISSTAPPTRGLVLWFTGIPGSGKSSLARGVRAQLLNDGIKSALLDGDDLRAGVSSDLGFSDDDRTEHIRRVGELALLLAKQGQVVLVACVSPFKAGRDRARQMCTAEQIAFDEIYCCCSSKEAAMRDLKGHYRAALAGELAEFTGVSSTYEEPQNAVLVLDTVACDLTSNLEKLLRYLKNYFLI